MVLFVQYPTWISPYVIPGLPIRWYAVMYLVAFAFAYLLFRYEWKHDGQIQLEKDDVSDLFFWGILGLLIGARVGSCLFYSDTVYYLTHPWMMFWPFKNGHFVGLPGMSFHGGVIGLVLSVFIFCKVKKISFLKVADMLAAAIPLGYTFGRLGNFINGELYGRVALKGGMLFPDATPFSTNLEWVQNACDQLGISYTLGSYVNLPRYPSQLYEAFVEGILLFLILWFLIRPLKIRKNLPDGVVMGGYFIGYGLGRFIIEYFRQPDADIGYVISLGEKSDNIALFQSFLNISKGQIYCFIMILCGVALIVAVSILDRKRVEDDKRKSKQVKKGNGKGRA